MLKTIGVYKITYIDKPELFYIGSSAQSVQQRFSSHKSRLSKNKHFSKHMQAIWNKHGKEAFFFEIIEECAPDVSLIREQHWIDTLKPFFNIYQVTGSPLGAVRGQETRDKISKTRKKLCQNGEIVVHNRRKVIRSDGIIFESVTHAAKSVNDQSTNISAVCKRENRICKGYYFQYLDSFIEWDLFIKEKKKCPYARKVICIETREIFESISATARAFGIKNNSHLCSHLKGKRKSFRKHTFEFYKE